MPMFTVIGLYDDGLTFAETTEARDAFEAMHAVAFTATDPQHLQIIGAIEGDHVLTAACEDSGKAAHVSDIARLL